MHVEAMLVDMHDPGIGASKIAVGGFSGISTRFDASGSRRRFRLMALLVVLVLLAGGYALLSRTQEAVWYLPASYRADPASTSVTIYVEEQACASGQAPSITRPRVQLSDSTVTIAVRTRKRFPLGPQSCQSNPLTPVTVDLGEPLGGRLLVDAYGDLIESRAPAPQGDSILKPSYDPPSVAQR